MSNLFKFTLVFFCVIFSVLVNIFFSDWISARLSLLPIIKNFNFVSSKSPIILKETKEIKVEKGIETKSVLNKILKQISSFSLEEKSGVKQRGIVLSYTSDGYFLVFGSYKNLKNILIQKKDSKYISAELVAVNPKINLYVFKANEGIGEVAQFSDIKSLMPGDPALILSDELSGFRFYEVYLNSINLDEGNPSIFSFNLNDFNDRAMAFNTKGEFLGVWVNKIFVSSMDIMSKLKEINIK